MKLLLLVLLSLPQLSKGQIKIDTLGNELNISADGHTRLTGGRGHTERGSIIAIHNSINEEVILLHLTPPVTLRPTEYAGVFFDDIPQLKHGLIIWRYKPWNSWTKPLVVSRATEMQDWDVQFFYWQYTDGLYGAAVALSGDGFRTTLGSGNHQWGSKAISYADNNSLQKVPAMAIAFGKNPYELFARIYRVALTSMGRKENISSSKKMPEALDYIGWCTWNASNLGRDLSEKHLLSAVKTFTDKKFPLGWVLIDDGWFQHHDGRLTAFQPDPLKFPNGFKPIVEKLKTQCGVKYMGIWHTLNGYWNGIDPQSGLGKKYKNRLFSWQQKGRPDIDSSQTETYYFLQPKGRALRNFFESWHHYLKNEGFDFLKVDNQLVTEKMAVGNFPIFSLSETIHKALYKSVDRYFNGAVINCMDMTAEAYLNFGSSAVARAVEDYFPYQEGETYNLQKGNAAAHVLQAMYNALYFSQLAFPDFDMFQSHHPHAVLHAVTRTASNGPIYLTDQPGRQNFDLLNKIIFADGRSIRSETALLPTEDCLFQIQEPRLFKAWSTVKNKGLLILMNLADTGIVAGTFKPSDVNGIEGETFALYECFSGKHRLAKRNELFDTKLPRMDCRLHYVVPVENGFAAFGLTNKYNAPATILSEKHIDNRVEISLYEGGSFKAYSRERPQKILIAGKEQAFSYSDNIITAEISQSVDKPVLVILWK